MHAHEGRQEGKYKKRKNLASTHGCLRVNDDDIAEIKKITDKLEKDDSTEKKGNLTLIDDLSKPVVYDDKRNEGSAETVKNENLSFKEVMEKYKIESNKTMKELHEAMKGINKVLEDINNKTNESKKKDAKSKG